MAAGFKKATVNASDVPATLSDYASYVDLSRLGITTLAEAQSVRVYTDEAKTAEVAREIVTLSEMWFKIAGANFTSTTTIYVDWDGVRADYAAGDSYGRNAVWSAFTTAWHLEDTTGSTGTFDLTNNGGTSTNAKIGEGYDYGGTSEDDYLVTTTNATTTLNTWTNFITVKMDTLVNYAGLFWKLSVTRDGDGAKQDIILIVHNDGKIGANPGGSWVFSTNASITTATWYRFAWVRSGSIISYYVNGTAYGTSTYANTNRASYKFGIGSWVSSVSDYRLDGIVDECTFTTSSRSADWVTTDYHNTMDEAGFWGTWTNAGSSTTPTRMLMGVGT